MARSRHNRSRNKEIWSSKRLSGKTRGCRLHRWSKTVTHRNERRASRRLTVEQTIEAAAPLAILHEWNLMLFQFDDLIGMEES